MTDFAEIVREQCLEIPTLLSLAIRHYAPPEFFAAVRDLMQAHTAGTLRDGAAIAVCEQADKVIDTWGKVLLLTQNNPSELS